MTDVDINPFVYKRTLEADIRSTHIPSYLPEQYAQCGEDIIILGFAESLVKSALLPRWDMLVCIEVGANHAFGGSNTYLLERARGVHSVLVEANPDLIHDLRAARPAADVVNAAICWDDREHATLYRARHDELSSLSEAFVETWHGGRVGVDKIEQVPAMRMATLLKQHVSTEQRVLLLSLDVEGEDRKILADIDFSAFRPAVVMLEPSEHFHPGEADRMVEIMCARGYCLLAKTDVNLVFADAQVMRALVDQSQSTQDAAERGAQASANREGVRDGTGVPEAYREPYSLVESLARRGAIHDGWKLDDAFIASVVHEVGDEGVLSLDVFDTALTRRLAGPADVFAEVEARMRSKFGGAAAGFAIAREDAEAAARVRQKELHGYEEVTLDEIYAELPQRLSRCKNCDEGLALELAVEREVALAVPDILELVHRVTALHRPYIFVSDMYLPREFVESLLRDAGYTGWSHLFISSAHRATKATGRIWQEVAERHPLPTVVHVGDNRHSDVVQPARCGVRTFEYGRVRTATRLGMRLTPAAVPWSSWQRQVELDAVAASPADDGEEQGWYRLGHGLGAFVVGTFVQWLADRVRLHRLDRLYFCARDGYLMQKAWEAAGFAETVAAEPRYLHVSRKVLNLAHVSLDSSPSRLSPADLAFLSSSFFGNTSVRQALERANLTHISGLVTEAAERFGALEAKLDSPHATSLLEELLARHSRDVFNALRDSYSNCVAYLKQEGLMNGGRVGIVDMGWHGTLQRSLSTICRHADPSCRRPAGFYYGLWPRTGQNRYAAGLMESCFVSPFSPPNACSELQQGVAFLEELHSAPHGSTVGYSRDNNGIHPVLQATSPAQAGNDRRATWFQRGTLDGVRDIFSVDGRVAVVKPADLSPNAALAALGAVFMSPSERELSLLSQIGHCATFDHSTLDPVVQSAVPATAGATRSALARSAWAAGQLRQWWLYGGDSTRALVREIAPAVCSHLGPRALRQFR